jgi:CubicO group peptidase (beta-lactamase class C family)
VLPGATQGATRRPPDTGPAARAGAQDAEALFHALDARIEAADEIVGYNVAATHRIEDARPAVAPALWPMPRTEHPTGGLISSARDQLRYARFHLGDGRAADGAPVLSPTALRAMRSDLGPGGTLGVEIDGVGVSWWQHRTAEGVPVFQHGGDWPGQRSGFFFVPERDFALTVLTNCTSGPALTGELFYGDGQPTPSRANFLPGPDGRIAWFSMFGRLYTRQG